MANGELVLIDLKQQNIVTVFVLCFTVCILLFKVSETEIRLVDLYRQTERWTYVWTDGRMDGCVELQIGWSYRSVGITDLLEVQFCWSFRSVGVTDLNLYYQLCQRSGKKCVIQKLNPHISNIFYP